MPCCAMLHPPPQDNWPSMPSVCSDLSPFYLAKARSNMDYWRRMRVPQGTDLGGVDGTGVEFWQAEAEALPAPDESFDVVGGTWR